jgi:deazaflavin-dependent oxidoreductase (nitroreductase family)
VESYPARRVLPIAECVAGAFHGLNSLGQLSRAVRLHGVIHDWPAERVPRGWRDGAEVDLDTECRTLTLRVLGRSVLGLDLDERAGWVLIASATGKENNPGWYHNLKAHPHCSLLVPHRGEVPCIARQAQGAERDRAWQAANTQYSGYAAVYQQRTRRRIPVMILVPEKPA